MIKTYKDILANGAVLSSSLHREVSHAVSATLPLSQYLTRELQRSDLGSEVGSLNYVSGSHIYFLKTKVLQAYSFLPQVSSESTEQIAPHAFLQQNLREGDVIISKDSNIGEIVILDRDYPDCMLSGALYRLPLKEKYKYYVLAFVKHPYFRKELDARVPKGATIRHAGTKFLHVGIPLPGNNEEKVVGYVSSLMRKIVDVEKEMKKKHQDICALIEGNILSRQKAKKFSFHFPSFSILREKNRIDTGIYSESFSHTDFILRNYRDGYFFIDEEKIKSGSTPKQRDICSANAFSDGAGLYGNRWVTPTNCSDWGFIMEDERINTPTSPNLICDAALLINRTSRGGKGEYVGISTFYDYESLGKGHHNQGIYRVTGYTRRQLITLTCFMNTPMMRNYCSNMSVGSKMKEIKAVQFLGIPIPKFDEQLLCEVEGLFYTPSQLFSDDPLAIDIAQTGVYHLHLLKDQLWKDLSQIIDKIINGEPLQ